MAIGGSRCGRSRTFFGSSGPRDSACAPSPAVSGSSYGSVHEVVQRATAAGLQWPLPAELDDEALERLLYRGNQGRPRGGQSPTGPSSIASCGGKASRCNSCGSSTNRPTPTGLQYTQFCVHFPQLADRPRTSCSGRPIGPARRCSSTTPGQPLPILNPRTGEIRPASLFVAALGASSMIFAEAHEAQTLPHWIGGHTHAVEYFQGVPEAAMPDNPKTGVAPRLLVRARTEPARMPSGPRTTAR